MLSLFHRKKLFVNRNLQGTITVRFLYYWVLYHVCVWHGAFMYFFLRERLTQLTGGGQMRWASVPSPPSYRGLTIT